MKLSSDQLIWLNGAVIALIIGSYLFVRRKPAEPVRLRMSDEDRERDVTGTAGRGGSGGNHDAEMMKMANRVSSLTSNDRQQRFEQALRDPDMVCLTPGINEDGVFFNYNGHTWDAFEVLGVRPGSPPEEVLRALQRTLSMVEPESRLFVQAAFEAIQIHRREHQRK